MKTAAKIPLPSARSRIAVRQSGSVHCDTPGTTRHSGYGTVAETRPRWTDHATCGPPELRYDAVMIFITAKFLIKPEYADQWPELSREFTEATRAEPGCKWFDWHRTLHN